MARVLAIDYGIKRCGIAVTDELQIIASALDTVPAAELIPFLKTYFENEKVEKVIVGDPVQMNGSPSESAALVKAFVTEFEKHFPLMPVEYYDERFTSKLAFQSMIDSGMKKKQRRDKAVVDQVAATILLQDFLNRKRF